MSMIRRPADSRGHHNHGWLDTRHSFSFADYFDPAHTKFRDLRVINEDVISPESGFAMHGHRDMEIITYVVSGALAHRDTTGGEGIIRRGDVQTMTAGTGVRHSEFNPSTWEDVHLLQIWLLPEQAGFKPAYHQKNFPDESKRNTLNLLAAPDGLGGTLPVHQDVRLYASLLDEGATLTHKLAPGRGAWLQLIGGAVEVNGQMLRSGDGLSIEDTGDLTICARNVAEFLLFDLK